MTPTPAHTPEDARLDELAELLISAARMAHARMAGAQDDRAFHDAGQTLHRMGRSLRQTLALKAKLAREQAEGVRKDRARAETERAGKIHDRKEQIRSPLERAIWDEAEDDDSAEREVVRLDDLVDALARAEGFLDEPVDQLITRIAHALGYEVEITAGAAARTTPPPARTADTS